MFDEINKYLGSWTDHSGSVGCEPVNRMLLGRKALSINMKGILQEPGLQIELGQEGLGPTLELIITLFNNEEYLEPYVVMGMYDDYEDDFGRSRSADNPV
ncbi:hypothetical protein [Paenibacillus puerhi]|uniref:hypothetical protein n=1 Tax=Paenibacillus puerhi TaxID=2692622 RepID=UPI0013577F7A|nr:hypothetical protein [Paenibacillus puerhi]